MKAQPLRTGLPPKKLFNFRRASQTALYRLQHFYRDLFQALSGTFMRSQDFKISPSFD